jgi:hypothetical protein
MSNSINNTDPVLQFYNEKQKECYFAILAKQEEYEVCDNLTYTHENLNKMSTLKKEIEELTKEIHNEQLKKIK